MILLMAEILHRLIGSMSHDLQGYIHPRWCRISSTNSMISSEIETFDFEKKSGCNEEVQFRTAKAGSLPSGKSMSY